MNYRVKSLCLDKVVVRLLKQMSGIMQWTAHMLFTSVPGPLHTTMVTAMERTNLKQTYATGVLMTIGLAMRHLTAGLCTACRFAGRSR
jgi:hypothetical protein